MRTIQVTDEHATSYATLRVFGPDLDPAEVSEYLEVEASHGHRAGDARAGGAAPFKEGQWALSTRDAIESSNLADHLRHLLDQVSPSGERLRRVLDRVGHHGDVFCYVLRQQGHGGPTLPPDVMVGLGALKLDLGLDIYGPFAAANRGRSADEMRTRTKSRLNDALRRPGMYGGQLVLIERLLDLAWGDRREDELTAWGVRLVERSMWTATGVEGAFKRLAPGLNSENGAASAFADIAWSLGWLDANRTLDAPDYWRMANESGSWIAEIDMVVGDIVQAFGDPSVSIGGSRGKALGFAGPEAKHPIVWFYASDDDDSIACRRIGARSFAEDVIFTPSGTAKRDPEPYPTEVFQDVPQPFRADWFQMKTLTS